MCLFSRKNNLPYADSNRLADVMALIQVLALDKHAHRSEDGLNDELQGTPKSANEWTAIAEQHPEFFRVRDTGTHRVSLVARHVLPKKDDGTRELNPDFVGKLLQAAIELHDRQLDRAQNWKSYIPIVVAFTAGLFTLFGIFVKSWISGDGS